MADYFGFIKLLVAGRAGGQNIHNILYYGNDVGEELSFNDAFLASFVAEWAEAHAVDWAGPMASSYTLENVYAWAVDQRGVVIGDNPAALAVGEVGGAAGDCSSPAICAILAIQTSRVASMDARSLRRSYLAIGPVPEVHVNTNGSLTATALSEYALVAAVVASSVSVGFVECSPVRVGRTVSPDAPAVGTLVSVTCQPYVSFRKSRKFRPNGT